eukprot:CAMPEP_0203792626 /NCGR_PEP_ID=MMETSP0100_2-20121128/5370_1 /ASSEMBLY_ACC=CAM_ASM_000210 /TAXON_ID=96639 /ORGANISM=" , Strain NY0313808BC1" /LENGTH=366 /DNA_ID=CAMNT_0050696227 /DNA_START=872 /DNA_END=1973 /DNA_ORIENTATION=-
MAAAKGFDDALKTLLDMGFPEEKCKLALSNVDPPTTDGAVSGWFGCSKWLSGASWLCEHELEWLVKNSESMNNEENADGNDGAEVKVVKSYKCVETGKLFRTMQDAQLYAERTGRANFEESDIEVPPLSEEEKQAKLAQIREKIVKRRKEREETEKKTALEQEKQRRKGGQQMAQIREEHERMQREREYEARKKEKQIEKQERERLRKEVAKDKAERAAENARRKGEPAEKVRKIYHDTYENALNKGTAPKGPGKSVPTSFQGKIDEAIKDLQSYRAGGDGERALTTLKKMLTNIQANPQEDKYRQINLQNAAFKKRVSSLRGGVALLKTCGFVKNVQEEKLQLAEEDLNMESIKVALESITKALT